MQKKNFAVKAGRYAGSRVNRFTFDSLADLADAWGDQSENTAPNTWSGGNSPAEIERFARQGGTIEHAQDVRDILDKITLPDMSGYLPEPEVSIVGAIPCVPALLAGHPANMIAVVEHESDKTPVNIWVDPVSSCHISADDCRKRGAALLALVQALCQVRPVTLNIAACTAAEGDKKASANCMVLRVNTTPMSEAEAGLIFGVYGFVRQMLYGVAKKHGGFHTQWPFCGNGGIASTMACLEGLAEDGDLIMPGIFSRSPEIQDPVGWVQEQLDKYANGNAYETENDG